MKHRSSKVAKKHSFLKTRPTFAEEKELWEKGYDIVIGLDEVGRGAFAGPVVVGAVVFSKNAKPDDGINDSKLLKPRIRQKLTNSICKEALFWTTTELSVTVINKAGIGKATHMAFRKAAKQICEQFPKEKKYVLVDGFHIRYIRGIGLRNQKGIIKGDQKSISIAAASIIAKVKRDSIMKKLHRKYPVYGFARHKGYGTKFHQKAIAKYGLAKIHRTSFNLEKFLS